MAPNSATFGFMGTPAFLARVMALPAFNDALNLATQVYDTTKRNEVMGAALRAAEASMRVAAMGALPLTAPILDRVGGWEAVDKWACRGLDRVEKVAPIIKRPTKEIVSRTRHRVLGAVAGDQVIVPPTFTEALIARANRLIDALTDNAGMRTAGKMADSALDTAHDLLDTYLPIGRGDRKEIDVRGAGVGERAVALVRTAGHRLYRTSLRTMRPDLAYFPEAVITPDMVVQYSRATLLKWYTELAREPRPGENFGLLVTVSRLPVRLTLAATLRLTAFLNTISISKATEFIASYSPVVQANISRARDIAADSTTRLTATIVQLLRNAGIEASGASNPLAAVMHGLTTAYNSKSVREAWDVALDYGMYVLEEARLWGKAFAVLIKLSPNIARKVSDSTRLMAAVWLREFMQFLEGGGRRDLRLYKKGFVPVKVTMMAPREAF